MTTPTMTPASLPAPAANGTCYGGSVPMRRIDLDDLPRWSPWPARLLGLDDFNPVARDVAKIEAEYEQDKYKAALAFYRENPGLDPLQVRLRVTIPDERTEYAGVMDGDLVVSTHRGFLEYQLAKLADLVRPAVEKSATVIELGCGMGANLWYLSRVFGTNRTYVGADFSANAVTLGNSLYADQAPITLETFNFFDATYRAIDAAEGPVTVFTVQALEQLPSAAHVVDVLAGYGDKIAGVVHMEPSYQLFDDSLLGLMRRRYIDLNDYNRDLLGALKDHPKATLDSVDAGLMGVNPFNLLSAYSWRPTA